jgi:4-amino-4-deoxy-L-arabinose transferase-like glycosyltransferase
MGNPRNLRRAAACLLAAAALGGCWILLLRNNCYCAAGPDSSGYLGEARLLASGRLSMPIEPLQSWHLDASLASKFTPIGFAVGRQPGTMVPTYPPGLPLLIATAALTGGWSKAAFLVVPLCMIGCLVLMVAIARELGISWGLAAGAATMLAAYPIFLFQSLVTMSDVPATCFVLLALFLALRSRERPMLAVLAGAALGAAVCIRPTNILAAIPLVFALRLRLGPLLRVIAGGFPFAIALLWLNATSYGSPFRTGYGSVGEVVSPAVLARCAGFHGLWLLRTLTAVALCGLLVVAARRIDRSIRWMLVSWFLVFAAFYSVYPVCSSWTDTRFLLPAVPALILGSLLLLQRVRPVKPWLAPLLAAAVLGWEIHAASRMRVLRADDYDSEYREVIRWAEPQLQKESVVMTGLFSGPWLFYTNRGSVRWDMLDGPELERLRATAPDNLTWYALLSDSELPPAAFRQRYRGAWTIVGRHQRETLWRLDR